MCDNIEATATARKALPFQFYVNVIKCVINGMSMIHIYSYTKLVFDTNSTWWPFLHGRNMKTSFSNFVHYYCH